MVYVCTELGTSVLTKSWNRLLGAWTTDHRYRITCWCSKPDHHGAEYASTWNEVDAHADLYVDAVGGAVPSLVCGSSYHRCVVPVVVPAELRRDVL